MTKIKIKTPDSIAILVKTLIGEVPSLAEFQDQLSQLAEKSFNIGRKELSQADILEKLTTIETKMNNLSIPLPTVDNSSYAQVLANSNKNPSKMPSASTAPNEVVLLIYPEKPDTPIAIDLVKKAFKGNLSNIRITRLHQIKKGGVLIGAKNKNDLSLIQDILSKSLPDSVTFRSPIRRLPEIRIRGIPKELSDKEVIPLIVKQNNIDPSLEPCLISCSIHITSFGRHDAILKIKNPLFKKLLQQRNIFLDLSSLPLVENFHIKTCMICFNTGHEKASCRLSAKTICRHCGLNHLSVDCPSKDNVCWRCSTYSKTPSSPHKYASCHCIIFQNEQKKLISLTDYTDHDV